MKKTRTISLTTFIITVVTMFAIVCVEGFVINGLCKEITIARYELMNSDRLIIMSPREFQNYLNELEPNNPIETDGIIGRQTLAKWNQIYCNQSAERTYR